MRGAINLKAFSNLGALTTIQVANAFVPILVFPFALATLGAERYAELVIAEALSVIVLTVVLYSFEVEGVGRVIDCKAEHDTIGLSRFFAVVISTRLVLFAFSGGILLTIVGLASGEYPVLLALWLLGPLGHVFFSYWYFQGSENNRPAAVLTVAARLVGIVAIFMTVKAGDDAWLIPLGLGLPFVIGGITACGYVLVRSRVRIVYPTPDAIKRALWNGKTIVLGNAAVVLYRDLNVVLLGAVGIPAAGIATYSLAEKVIKMVQATSRPLNQLYFPKAIRALAGIGQPTVPAAKSIARMTAPQLLAMAAVIVVGYTLYQSSLSLGLLPDKWQLPADIWLPMLVMIPAVFLGVANYMFGVVGLNYLGARTWLASAILMTGLVNIMICAALATRIGAIGGALAFTLAEFVLLVGIVLRYRQPLRACHDG